MFNQFSVKCYKSNALTCQCDSVLLQFLFEQLLVFIHILTQENTPQPKTPGWCIHVRFVTTTSTASNNPLFVYNLFIVFYTKYNISGKIFTNYYTQFHDKSTLFLKNRTILSASLEMIIYLFSYNDTTIYHYKNVTTISEHQINTLHSEKVITFWQNVDKL